MAILKQLARKAARHVDSKTSAPRQWALGLRLLACLLAMLALCAPLSAQRFFNLTADEVRIDTVMPVFTHAFPLGYGYADSVYSVTIEYPEFIPMSDADVQRCQQLLAAAPPAMPAVSQTLGVVRKQGLLQVAFSPIVCRNGRYQKLVSFMLRLNAQPKAAPRRATDASQRYAASSVLKTGKWAKIRVPQTGVYQLTTDLIRQAGFSDVSKVKVYGYGGALQPEVLTASYLTQTDDLQEVPTCTVAGRRLFYAVGPVTWNGARRVRNPYSDYGYYFLTESDGEPASADSAAFVSSFYPAGEDRGTLYEVDDYAWYTGGRNLYDAQEIKAGSTASYSLAAANSSDATLTVALTAVDGAAVTVSLNDSVVGTINVSMQNKDYDAMRTAVLTCSVANVQQQNTVTLTTAATSGTTRLDYISLYTRQPKAAPSLSTGSFAVPEYVYRITNQDHHADTAADMVIIIPTSLKLQKQAERLKALHEKYDALRVNIVPADELYNEFSSGTPDANAYRRYLKMLYDRAETEADMPRFLLLLGDGAWDNRMRSTAWVGYSPDDFLLCYESENSYSHTQCYLTDDYFCMLDDGEGADLLSSDKADVAVGRISARNDEQAGCVVDKIESYISNTNAGAWQNTICFMGDDGNNNQHMQDADDVAKQVEQQWPDLMVKRIMWDAYTRVSSSTGNTYPDVTRLIKQQMQQGALIMNYSGHGRADAISHEYVLTLSDFENFSSPRLPLWITASCDIMPFDGQEENIGETCLFNKKGGVIAFYGTTRTVYQAQNRLMNQAFMRRVLSSDADGRPMPIGEAVRLAKIDLLTTDQSENKLQYSLLGDPALRLALPQASIVLDSVNGTSLAGGTVLTLKAGTIVNAVGRVLDDNSQTDASFNGIVTAVVRDAREEIVCKLNDTSEADDPFVYYDRLNTIFNGSDSVRNGRFAFTFVVPKDISYSAETVQVNLYAINAEKSVSAAGLCNQLVMNGSANMDSDGRGPSIYCYLNSASFTNGDRVNPTPYFVAELSDEDGINATGSGIGHDLQLIIDGDMTKTYALNDYFQYDFGSYTSGTIGYSIPTLDYGEHRLQFRAWDVKNNSSTTELTFSVAKGLEPVFSMDCTPNPATTSTTFRIMHDRANTDVDVVLDIFDISGRHLWTHREASTADGQLTTIDWDLTVDGGRRLQTGVYLYRIRLSSDGSGYASRAKKLIVLTHQ